MANAPELLPIPGLGKTEIIPTDMMPHGIEVPKDGEAKTPGGTIGLMMAFKAAAPQLSAEEAADWVLKWEKYTKTPPRHIFDSHVELALRGSYEDLYGVSADDVAAMKAKMEEAAQRSPSGLVVIDAALAQTRPEAVLMTAGDFQTVTPTVTIPRVGTQPVIRIDTERLDGRLADLAAYVNRKDIEVSNKALIGMAKRQRNATLILTADGLPQYSVDLRLGRRRVIYRNTVPKLR